MPAELSISEAVQISGASRTWIRGLIARGLLRSRRTSLGIFVDAEDVARLAVERAAKGRVRRGRLLLHTPSVREPGDKGEVSPKSFPEGRANEPTMAQLAG